ncbi:dual specificity mitogen-activated protein kinase kinase hemipterous-like isoform X2 [Wyeomyia smithii]|uniref:dual specificity mitogen-activated protein kinase kinase hemipterous-like isoform X2 n=1 Tax=Wyeomyia smithii TaxID=174621 RepID=UPI002467C4F7|nr:dual specificity mitogen-activated protein kinase kinase hemipterous-like isoform X2 [Wyeomyia smithii]
MSDMQSSIGNRINMIEARLQIQQPQPQPRTPPTPHLNFDRALGSGRGRPNLELPLLIPTGTHKSDSEQRFQKIIDKSGMLKINDQIYKSTLNDMQELGELGSGTSGHVVKMRHKPSGAIVAVKQMRRTGNDEENKRIIMDLDVVLKSEKCGYIVKCLGFFITDADVWICMELMTTCFDKLLKKSKKPIPEQILAKVTVATVNALAYLKETHRVIHRDVKPSNILIDDRGNIKLCDFGISGRLINSNAKTRSAGCAAYMAPERIDPAKFEYDIRADVWSLGITLVELATAVFPYPNCKTDFEVLTKVLTSQPPRLPEGQPFSEEFRDFVKCCLQKDYLARPKYPDLLKHAFLRRAELDTVTDVAGWFRNVAQSCDIQLTTPQLIACGSATAAPASSFCTGYAPGSSPTSVSNQRPSSSASDQNRVPTPFESLTEAVQAQSSQQKQTVIASSIPVKSNNMPNHTNTSSSSISISNQSYEPQNSGLDSQQTLQMKLNSISLTPAASTTSSSTLPYNYMRSPSPGHHLQAQQQAQMQTPQAHYLKLQPKSAIVSNSSNFSNATPDGTRKYKQSPFFSRRANDSGPELLAYGSPKKESTLSSLGQSILKNLTTSPFSHRKSEQKSYKPPLPGEDGGGGVSMLNGNRPGFSNPASPLLLNRKMIDLNDDQQYKHLQGNTSPIVLQRFYHQQNQLRENKQQQQELHLTNPFYQQAQQPSGIPIKCSPLPSHKTVHHAINPVLHNEAYIGYQHMVPPEASNIPTFQYQPHNTGSPKHKIGNLFNTFSRTKSQHGSGPSQRESRAGSDLGYPEGGFYQNHHQLYGRQTLPEYGSTGLAMQSGISHGDNIKEDTGWFNSITDLAKRRFASFVKLNLASSGEKRPKGKHLQNQLLQQQQLQQQQYLFTASNGTTMAPMNNFSASSSNPFGSSSSGIPSAIPPTAAVHMLSSDRRHRSPDPPPRFNRGQSPLLLHRKLEKLGQTGSPILNHRFTSTSPSPPLPPRRGSESVPGSPQHVRTRMHYTPEPHRRPYRTIDQ